MIFMAAFLGFSDLTPMHSKGPEKSDAKIDGVK